MESNYIPVRSRNISGRMADGWLSPGSTDPAWDHFLQSTSLGHYEQSTLWARAKRCEGWWPIRIVLSLDGHVAGGVQILARRTRLGDVGYINRGPVVLPEDPALLDFLMDMLVLTTKTKNLRGLVVRPPDESTIDDRLWAHHRFLPNDLVKFDSATLAIDLAIGMESIKRGMRRSVRKEVRQSEERGIKVREGGEEDIHTFFALLMAICHRLGKKPQPATEKAFLEVWKAFQPSGCARLSFVEFDAEIIAGLFSLCFGARVTAWRMGWSGKHRERHPNHRLMCEAIQWAHDRRYKVFDFAGLDRDIAISLLRGDLLLERQKAGKDFAHLGYGGTPRLLADSHVYISHPLLRFAYRAGGLGKAVRRFQKRLLK
jgi:lipid II:glycine glycyltransferase (peptidoglycan interpeptide bridge formation enzyme)